MHPDLGDVPGWFAAVVAVAAALVAAFYSHRSVSAANRSAKADERVAHHLDQPRFTAEIEAVNDGGWHRLALTLEGPIAVPARVDVEWLDPALQFAAGVDGVDKSATPPVRTGWAQRRTLRAETPLPVHDVEPGGMVIGETQKWMIERTGEEPPDKQAKLLVTAKADESRAWEQLVRVDVPLSLRGGPNVY